jgi:Superinfection immunity protein
MYHGWGYHWHYHPFFWHPFGAVAWLALAIGLALYFLPTLIARSRDVASTGGIFLANLLFGWTMLGWIACLVWAMAGTTRMELARRYYGDYPPPPDIRRSWS